MMIGQAAPRQPPTLPESLPSVGDVLTSRRFSALSNVIVFTPYAIYLARGKRPPSWLIAASLAFLAVSFFEDLRVLAAPTSEPLAGTTGLPVPFPGAMQYRVNR